MAEVMEEIRQARPRRFRPYPEYRDSEIEWLGEVPAEWQEYKLGYLANSISGGTPTKDNPEFWRGDIPWVSPKDMKVRIIRDAADHISSVALSQTGLKLIQPPAVLIVVRGMILAHTFPVAVTAVPATINQDMKALKLRSGVSSEFFAYLIEGAARYFLSLIEEAGHGTKRLRSDLWRSTKLFLPALDEQRAIAAFLDRESAKIDGLVAKKERLIELLQEKRTALITRAVTQGLDPNVPMKDSGVEWLGKIPAHWGVKPLKHIAVFINGVAFKPEEWGEEGTPIIRIENLNGGENFNCTTRLVPSRFHAQKGDLLFGWSGNRGTSFGPFLWWRDGQHYVNQHIFKVVNYDVHRSWLYWMLRGITFYVEKQAHGIIGMVHITRGELGKIQVPVVPLSEQETIASFIDAETLQLDSTIAKVREAIDRLKEFRTALISAAVTGKIDVREEAS